MPETSDPMKEEENSVSYLDIRRPSEPLPSEAQEKRFWDRVQGEMGVLGKIRSKIEEKAAKVLDRHRKPKNPPGLHIVK